MRRGVSELVSAVILIAIVLAGMIIFTYLFSISQQAKITSLKDIMETKKRQANELLSILHAAYHGGVIHIYVYNYGNVPIEIAKVFVNDSGVYFEIYDAYSYTPADVIEPGKPYKIEIPATITKQSVVAILTKSGNLYSIKISP